jgi:sec-independent protein translocase protein TatA
VLRNGSRTFWRFTIGQSGVGFGKFDKFMNIMFAWALGGMEVVLILVVILVLFGSKKIPEFARGLGQGIKEFKKASREVTDEIQNAATEMPSPARPAANSQSQPAPAVSQSPNPPKA